MLNKMVATGMCLVAAVILLAGPGCVAGNGPVLGPFAVPIPVTPYIQERWADRAYLRERYETVPILGPITAGGPATALDPPSDDEVMHALERARPVEGGIPLLHEIQRENVRIVKEKIADYIDPPRVVPLIGPAQLHHAHYKCTVYFTERTWVGWPIPHMIENEDAVEVLYIDHNHFHMVGNIDPGVGTNY